MKEIVYKLVIVFVSAFLVAALPAHRGLCECSVEGEVCGDSPTWNPCCEPNKYECEKDEGDEYGECVPKEGSGG